MTHKEAALKSALFKQLHLDAPDFLILQIATAGGPDREVIGNKRTSYWECKHGTPYFISHGNQELICQRIANQGFYCRYILWIDEPGEKYTLIVHPLNIRTQKAEWMGKGHNHKEVSAYIRDIHLHLIKEGAP